ncbi:T-cell ecto-ADP-ribosyltransferase 1-like isoform X2 [Acipenser ruthenus]|uniref:T-cell ecto-ADP-ribosyltransferase 1-like isoform X2 n=1 Tax=Acipenser ruthenus TaxID=7906 RepID=UPI002742844B|nr:T-cell ecto-ADP-ribosyltransferase 1-like isoform X2 [Acipenser ruthenus]
MKKRSHKVKIHSGSSGFEKKCEDPTPMDMAEDALDDKYRACRDEMLKKFNREYILLKELNAYKEVRQAWIEAEERMKKLNSQELSLLQATAIHVYTMDSKHSHSSTLNKAVRTVGKNYSNFPFKAWHFHLTDALQTLKAKEPKCYDVFRGVQNRTKVVGDIVRFGYFASTSENKSVAEGFRKGTGGSTKGTLFTITSCFGVSIEKYSYNKSQQEVLIPPFEIFRVTKVNGNEIQLEHIMGGATVFKIQHTLTVFCVIWPLILMQTH